MNLGAGGQCRSRLLPATVVTITFLLLAGCARRPPRIVEGLSAELAAARDACAETFAAEEIARAQALAEEAERVGKTWRRRRAAALAREARAALQTALAVSARRKQEAVEEAGRAIAEARDAVAGAEADGAREEAPEPLARADEEIRSAGDLLDSEPCRAAEAAEIARRAAASAREAAGLARAARERREREAAEEAARRAREEAEREARRRREAEEAARRPAAWEVARGDCLWRIAARPQVFGDPFQWPLLHRANRHLIRDPDLIFPGQRFRIPREVSREERLGAIREARERVWPTPGYLFDGR